MQQQCAFGEGAEQEGSGVPRTPRVRHGCEAHPDANRADGNSWVKNFVSLGLASFLEPLESTSIFLVEYGLANLITFFPSRTIAPARAAVQPGARHVYEELRDFLLLHYVVADRGDTPFWRAAAAPEDDGIAA